MASARPTPPQSRRGTLDSVELVERAHFVKKPPRSGSHSPSQYEPRRRLSSFGTQRRLFLDLVRRHGSKLSLSRKSSEASRGDELGREPRWLQRDRALARNQLTVALSALYSKLLIILGVTLPITELVAIKAPANFHQGFYLYLHVVSILFCTFLYLSRYQQRAQRELLLQEGAGTAGPTKGPTTDGPAHSASFYLRIGAIAFGIGSLVYSALDFGQYFEMEQDDRCRYTLVALMPAVRMVLCVVQMQFIIVSGRDFGLDRHPLTCRFGLMHMLATNVCEWLYVLVEEAKHEILQLGQPPANVSHPQPGAAGSEDAVGMAAADGKLLPCRTANIMGTLVHNAAPFLFPCTIEYSLICALTLYELWNALNRHVDPDRAGKPPPPERPGRGLTGRAANRLSVDCSSAQRGLFGGIVMLVLTFIVLIMYFVLRQERGLQGSATREIVLYELGLYTATLLAVAGAMVRMRDLRVPAARQGRRSAPPLPLDCHLLLVTQTGIYIYGVFSIIGTYHAHGRLLHYAVLSEVLELAQTSLQTLFVLSSWWRRCRGARQNRAKPGRQIVTFLLVANFAAWLVNALVKSNASFRPLLMSFYGPRAWVIIAHVSMPLAIFYRFHSTICLFEIWKNTYKARYNEP